MVREEQRKQGCMLTGSYSLQILPKGVVLRMNGNSSKPSGFQKCTHQSMNSMNTLISFIEVKFEMGKNSLAARLKCDTPALQMPHCPGLAKQACDWTPPETWLIEGVGFQLLLRNVCPEDKMYLGRISFLTCYA